MGDPDTGDNIMINYIIAFVIINTIIIMANIMPHIIKAITDQSFVEMTISIVRYVNNLFDARCMVASAVLTAVLNVPHINSYMVEYMGISETKSMNLTVLGAALMCMVCYFKLIMWVDGRRMQNNTTTQQEVMV